jgi:hypothetical protein
MLYLWMRARFWLAGLLCFGVTGFASAQVFQLSTDPDTLKDATSESVSVRPNTPEKRYIFVKNPVGNLASYTVEMRDASNGALLATGSLKNMKKDETLRVKLEKAPPPPAPKTAAPAAPPAPAPTPAPPAPEPPQGLELKGKDGNFIFVLRLLDDKGDLVMVGGKSAEAPISVIYRNPRGYFGNPTTKISKKDGVARVDVEIASTADFLGPTAVVELYFPPQPSVRFDSLRGGTYRRTVAAKNETVRLQADNLPLVEGQEKSVRFDINVDGYPRAFKYDVDFSIVSMDSTQQFDRTPAVTVLPVGADRAVKTIPAKPADKTPVRIQVDNAPDKSRLALRFDRDQNRAFSGSDEIIVIGKPREEHAYVEPQGENDAILVTYQVTDHTYYLNTRSMRGRFELQGVLLNEKDDTIIIKTDESKDAKDVVFSVDLILDDTAPEGLQFAKLPAKHVKGTPLPVRAFADEPETSITQAIFFIGKPVDGKLPDTKVEGELIDRKKNLFVGQLPIPDKKGVIEVGVQFVNETGVTATKTQKIELIDPVGGSISGTVDLGGRGQPGVVVSLRDAEGKEKGTAVTEDEKDNKADTPKDQRKSNGKFKFENVPPGTYRLFANKPDSGVGTKGSTSVQVQAGVESKVTVPLARKP